MKDSFYQSLVDKAFFSVLMFHSKLIIIIRRDRYSYHILILRLQSRKSKEFFSSKVKDYMGLTLHVCLFFVNFLRCGRRWGGGRSRRYGDDLGSEASKDVWIKNAHPQGTYAKSIFTLCIWARKWVRIYLKYLLSEFNWLSNDNKNQYNSINSGLVTVDQ